LQANNITAVNAIVGDTITVRLATVTANATIANAAITTGNIGTLNTQIITTGSNSTGGTLTGTWTANGGSAGNTIIVTNGNLVAVTGIKTDNYYYANGSPFNPTGTYNNGNVFDYLTGSNAIVQFSGNIAPGRVTTQVITAGANTTAGNITGNWTLTTGSRLQATYADLAEYYEADTNYEPGTVLEFGGDKEVTIAEDGTTRVAGVVSTNPAYAMNATCQGIATAIALQGRVPTKVRGIIYKGDMMVSAGNGFARPSTSPQMGTVIGKALENFDGVEGIIEVAVGRL
jgi:hypothetical protein